MNTHMSDAEVFESAKHTLLETMFHILERNLSEGEKLSILTNQYNGHVLVQGTFFADRHTLFSRDTLNFKGEVCGIAVEISVY